MWVEYYIDGESTPSIAFQPSMMCGLGFPTQIAKDFEYSAGGLCGKTAPVGGWSNTFPIPFYKSAVVTVRADPSDGAGCYGGYVSVRGTPRLPLVLPHSGLPLPTGSRLTLQRQPLLLRQPLEFVTLATLLQGQSGFLGKRFQSALSGLTLFERGTEYEYLSAFRLHTSDPLVMTDGGKLTWRVGAKADPGTTKWCGNPLPPGAAELGLDEERETVGRQLSPVNVTTYAWVYTPPLPLSSAARLRVLRDAASALHYLHTLSPMILHRDVSAGNILLDERGNGFLADVGLARAAEATAGQVSHLSTQRIFGKPGYMDPIISLDGQASQLTDGFALGITLLVALTGRGALGLLNECYDALEEPDTAEGIAAADAGWSAAQAEELARLVVGLAYERKRKRMPLADALPRLEAMTEAAGEMAASPPPSLAGAVAAEADADAERQCDLCWSAPRSVRFACGHALYCEACVPRVLERDTNCPTCRQPALPIAALE
ncbi:hypothetical protein EMIHUDRAFT_453901 [Emiliania huxleyi CCMP1516]|uniref:Protein kinase domain-containing protein n=2 Tax=Emiliania huxleyi TaxID=2903 RepID=A0A0D3HZG9_EMIH1|nr:hypothetical protein EMIHUDRAFT_453901 [Emiliania huxleyi CCMP1516]EOD04404.1 hypothetical protein EMIHUDRAFT_453901 [Emiliania huxleyi CCMP1516]|eukprot:XP_005756833.1 hypothetical protein EMIHUDRAFT_453901 [Emiliania huxleyi CCMP1516]